MRFRFLLLPLFVLAIVSGVLLAQSIAPNDAIDECSKAQAIAAIIAIDDDDFIQDYGDLYGLMDGGDAAKTPAVAQATLRTVVEMRERYYADIQPAMPDCAGSVRAQLAFSDALAELTFMMSSVNLINEAGTEYDYFADMTGAIGTRYGAATQRLLDSLQELQALSGI